MEKIMSKEAKRRKDICEKCEYYNKETEECIIGIGCPRISRPWEYLKSCGKWEEKEKE